MGKMADRLFAENRDWAVRLSYAVARRFPRWSFEDNEREQAALIGLWDAAQKFERVGKGGGFRFYATKRVLGQVVDVIRREKAPWTRVEYEKMMEDGGQLEHRFLSLQMPINKDGAKLQDFLEDRSFLPPDEELENSEELAAYAALYEDRIGRLSRRYRRILELRMDGLSVTKIAKRYRISTSRVSQIVRKSARILRKPALPKSFRGQLKQLPTFYKRKRR
jgi:RNA polymerase sigma factor (sigma-70 family)